MVKLGWTNHKTKLEAQARYREKNRPKLREANRLRSAKLRQDPKFREKANANLRIWRNNLRKDILDHYGHKCACCGETRYEFLAIDHKNGGGNEHRRMVGIAGTMMLWIKNNGYPDMIQISCHNCNNARGFYGRCPHLDTVNDWESEL